MKLSLPSSFLIALMSLLLVNASPAFGQATTEPKVKKIPFHGKLESIDASANTITLESKKGGRVFHLTPETKITDGAGNPSTLSAATVGEDVGGSYSKDAAGTMTLFSVRFGAKAGSKAPSAAPAAAPAPAAPAATAATPPPAAPAAAPEAAAPAAVPPASTKVKKERFSGKVVSVDAASDTLVIHGKADQTFTLTSATKITGADSLASVTAGEKVSGTYSKSADGATLTVYTLKVTK
jgi:hypothetical protein